MSPLMGLVALFKSKSERAIIFCGTLFFVLLGSVFVYVDGTDGYDHMMNAKTNYLDMTFSEFFKKTYEILTFNSTKGATDIYLHIISFISSSLFQSPPLIHVFAGLVLGYFFTKSVLIVLQDKVFAKKNTLLIAFITLFIIIKSIGALNPIRMWTGMWVLFYGTYSFVLTRKRKYIIIILFSVFIHFSYSVILVPVILSFLMQKRKKILISAYFISFFTSVSFSYLGAFIPDSDLFKDKQQYSVIDSEEKEEFFEEEAKNYQKASANFNFYKAFGEPVYLNYSIVFLTLILCPFYLKARDSRLIFLVSTGIGIYTFANLVGFSPALQGRSKMIAATFILAAAIHLQLTIKNYRLNRSNLNWLNVGLIAFLISALPNFLLQISEVLYNTSFFLLLFPQVSWLLGDYDLSIRNAIGLLID